MVETIPRVPIYHEVTTVRGPVSGVSILIPSYNYARYLKRAIDSARAQAAADLEIVIGDNASTDDSWAIIEAAAAEDTRIRAFRNETNIGMVANARRVLELATKERVLYLSADDYLLPGHIATLVAAHEAHPEIDYFFTSYVRVDEEDRFVSHMGHRGHLRASYFGGRNEFADLLTFDCYACLPTTLCRREDLLDHVLPPGLVAGDLYYYLRLAAAGRRFGFIDKVSAVMRLQPH
jgi:O-antigen biosynthesis protein